MSGASAVLENFAGIIPNLTLEEYHAAKEFLSSTVIRAGLKSMAHVKAALDREDEVRSSSFDLGTSMHSTFLEQSTDVFVIGPDVSTKATKEWKEFVAANPGKIHYTRSEANRIIAAFRAAVDHPIAHQLVSPSKIEHSFFAIDQATGLQIKARPDGYCKDDKGGDYIFDYKTTSRSSARREDFQRMVGNYGYDIQAAHYKAVVESVTGRPIKDFFFIVQETQAPYALSIFRASEAMLERGEMKRRSLLNQIAVAMKTNNFPAYDPAIVEIDLPSWAVSSESDDFGVAI